ncbi:MAG: trigger factor [Eggerthellaceae bacterium]|nr:trigger factor [Eggerthellaceae bacterium]
MKVTQKKLEENLLRLEVTATAEEVDQAFAAAQVAFAQQMNLRPQADKTVSQVAEETMGIKDLDSVVASQAAEYFVPFALDKKDIVPAYPPSPEQKSPLMRGAEYKFRLDVAVKPHYELSSYDRISLVVPVFEVSDQEVEEQLAQMAESYGEYQSADPHPVQDGDHVLLAIEAKRDGEPLPGLTTEARTYTTGAGYMPEGFDSNVIGMEVGETKSFTFTGPGFDEQGNDREERIECTVSVKEIQKRVIPAITDAWVQENLPFFSGVEVLKSAIRDQMERSYEEEHEKQKMQSAAAEIAKRFQGKIDDPVYESMQKNIMNDLRMQLRQQNISFDQFIEQNGGQQQFSMMMMLQTRQTLIEGYSLDAVFRHEKMVLTDEDILEACKVMNPQQPTKVREQMEKAGCGFLMRESAARIKASRWLVENAEITLATS